MGAPAAGQGILLTDELMQSFDMGRVHPLADPSNPGAEVGRTNSIDFHRTENVLVTAGDDDSIRVYDTISGESKKTLFSKKYGVANICFTHNPNLVVYSSNKGTDHALRYLSLHDNCYQRYFKGHTARVTKVCMSPKSDLFMSGALDKQIRLWDLRTAVCQGVMQAPFIPCPAFDEQGLVFCIGTAAGVVKLYDVRSFNKGPFDTFSVPAEAHNQAPFSCIRFSPNGKLMLGVVDGRIYLLDAYNGTLLHSFVSGAPEASIMPMEACFSPDGQYVLSGSEDQQIRVWSTVDGRVVATLRGHTDGVPTSLRWAPRRMLLASASRRLVLWVPGLERLRALASQQGQQQQQGHGQGDPSGQPQLMQLG